MKRTRMKRTLGAAGLCVVLALGCSSDDDAGGDAIRAIATAVADDGSSSQADTEDATPTAEEERASNFVCAMANVVDSGAEVLGDWSQSNIEKLITDAPNSGDEELMILADELTSAPTEAAQRVLITEMIDYCDDNGLGKANRPR